MLDLEAAIRAHLGSLAALTAVYGNRMYAARSLPPEYRSEDGPGLLFMIRGGGQEFHSQLYKPSVQFRSYAATEREARTAARALYDALNDTQGRGFAWIRLEEGTLPTLLNEPGTNWPFVLSFYRFQIQNL